MTASQPWPEETAEDLYENAPCGYFSTLLDGTIIRANRTFLKQTGHSPEALIGHRVQEFMTTAGRVFYETHFAPLLRMQGSVKEIACDLRRSDSTPLPVLLNAVQIFNEAGEPTLVRFAVFDATDRRLYESELRNSRKRAEHYAAIVKASADAILSIAADGTVQTWNAGAERLFGYTSAEAVGHAAFELIVPAEDEASAQKIVAELRAGRAVRRETVCTGKGGRSMHVSVSLTPHIEPPGELTGVSAILRDISERKVAGEALERYRLLAEGSRDIMVFFRTDGRIVEVNRAAVDAYGHTREELIGTSFFRIRAPETRDEIAAQIQRVEEGPFRFETIHVRKDGSRFPVEVSWSLNPIGGERVILSIIRDITERREAEEQLRASEQRLRLALEASAVGIWEWNVTTGSIRWDAQMFRIYGIEPTKDGLVPYHMWTDAVLPADLPRQEEVLQDTVRRLGRSTREFRIRRPGCPECRHIQAVETVRANDAGQAEWVVGTNLDITESRRAEAALRASEEHLADFFENATIGLHWVGPDGIVLRVNKAELNLLGYTREEYVGHHIAEFHARQETIDEILRRLMNGEELHDFEAQLRCKDGSLRDVLIASSVLRDGDGRFIHSRCFTRDITERKAAEKALRESTTRLALGVQVAEIALAEIDYLTGMNHLSAEAARLFGLGDAGLAVPREVVHATFHPEDRAELLPRIAASLDPAGAGGFAMDHRVVWPDGEVRWLRVRKQVVFEGEGSARRPMRAMLVALDVTAEKTAAEVTREAKENAEAANRAKDRFLAVLSHELRTPLTPVLMTVAALEHEPDLRPDLREDFTMMKRNIELEIKLIDDLLDLNRIISGKLELKIEPIDLNEAVRHVCAICRPQILEQSVRLETDLCDDAGLIAADPARLRQVLWNVLRNAINFTPANGAIHVSTARLRPDRCEIRVRDSGVGIPADMLSRIFDAFEQGDVRITRQFGGLGLGLAICRALVELHGGSVRAESGGEGCGATFIIEIPGKFIASSVAASDAAPAESGAANRIRLLLVEDHADTARLLERHLRRAGFAVTVAHNVSDGLAAAARDTFDVVVSDLGLPDGTGCDLIRGVRESRPLPGIAMSGYGMDEDIRRSREAGFSEHLVKPVEVPQLIEAIRRATAKRDTP